jgi:hypothetical protein
VVSIVGVTPTEKHFEEKDKSPQFFAPFAVLFACLREIRFATSCEIRTVDGQVQPDVVEAVARLERLGQ